MSNASFAKASKVLSSLSMAGMPLSVEVLEHETGIRRLALDKILGVMVFYGGDVLYTSPLHYAPVLLARVAWRCNIAVF